MGRHRRENMATPWPNLTNKTGDKTMTNEEIIARIDAHEEAIRFHIEQVRKLREQYNTHPSPFYTNITVDCLHFTPRAGQCLQNEGIETLGQLLKYSAYDLMQTKNFGRKSLREIREALKEKNLYLAGDKQ